jgi:hypothetical protein
MKRFTLLMAMAAAVLVLATAGPAAAAPFEPSTIKVTVADSLWANYHLEPEASGETVRALKIKRVEVAVLTGTREFAVHSFTPKDPKSHAFTIPHGVPNLKIRLQAWAADDTHWLSITDLKDAGDNVVVRSLPGPLSVYTPGI